MKKCLITLIALCVIQPAWAMDKPGAENNRPIDLNKRLQVAAIFDLDPTPLITAGADLRTKNSDGKTILSLAANNRSTNAMQALLDAGADANALDDDECSPLLKVLTSRGPQIYDICALLLAHHADPNQLNANGHAPLYLAIDHNDRRIFEILRKYKAWVVRKSAITGKIIPATFDMSEQGEPK